MLSSLVLSYDTTIDEGHNCSPDPSMLLWWFEPCYQLDEDAVSNPSKKVSTIPEASLFIYRYPEALIQAVILVISNTEALKVSLSEVFEKA